MCFELVALLWCRIPDEPVFVSVARRLLYDVIAEYRLDELVCQPLRDGHIIEVDMLVPRVFLSEWVEPELGVLL